MEIAILFNKALFSDASIPEKYIAEAICLSTSAKRECLNKLEKCGIQSFREEVLLLLNEHESSKVISKRKTVYHPKNRQYVYLYPTIN